MKFKTLTCGEKKSLDVKQSADIIDVLNRVWYMEQYSG
jgi:hypothetical protein